MEEIKALIEEGTRYASQKKYTENGQVKIFSPYYTNWLTRVMEYTSKNHPDSIHTFSIHTIKPSDNVGRPLNSNHTCNFILGHLQFIQRQTNLTDTIL